MGATVISIEKAQDQKNDYRYAVYEHKLVTEEGLSYVRSFIVIKNQYGMIVRFTRLHQFIGAYHGKVFRPIYSDVNARMYYICNMLNYILIEHHERYKINHVFLITKNMLTDFFSAYAIEKKKNGLHRSEHSVENCVHTVVAFFDRLIRQFSDYMKMKQSELYEEKVIYTPRGQKKVTKSPAFQVRGICDHYSIFRDIPTKVLRIMLNLAVRYYPDIAFAIGLQVFAGLRPGEVCNVRRISSPKGPGLILTYRDGELTRANIDLRYEYAMRSDGVSCGNIKKERIQGVYPAFLRAFETLYKYHQEYLDSHEFEESYSPMFINNKGMAMTYNDYYSRFRQLTDQYLRPYLLNSPDMECRIYGQMLCENKLSPHALRHWFSVQLALRGEDIAQLQFWRGDKNPSSALHYLQNKGELVRELIQTNQFLTDFMMEVGNLGNDESI